MPKENSVVLEKLNQLKQKKRTDSEISRLLFFQDLFFFLHDLKSSLPHLKEYAPSIIELNHHACEFFRSFAEGDFIIEVDLFENTRDALQKTNDLCGFLEKLNSNGFLFKKYKSTKISSTTEAELEKNFENTRLDSLSRARAIFCFEKKIPIKKEISSLKLKDLILWEKNLQNDLFKKNRFLLAKKIDPDKDSTIQITYWTAHLSESNETN